MWQYFLDHPDVVAASLSAVATALAAYATLRGPASAARLAERLRREADASAERHRMKMWVFTTLMQERASTASLDAVRALNLVDVVFKDSPAVREAWAELYLTFDPARDVPFHVREERLRGLLRSMALDMGLADGLRPDDFGRVYYPNALAEEENVRQLERRAALARLTPQASPTSNASVGSSSPLTESLFPPAPSLE